MSSLPAPSNFPFSAFQPFSFQHFSFSVRPPTTRTEPVPISGLTRFTFHVSRFKRPPTVDVKLWVEMLRAAGMVQKIIVSF
jgi:hypothetical protein